jgi:hypothetical protein
MIKVDFNPPDVWYDFYARVLPGTTFAAYLFFVFSAKPDVPNGSGIIILLMVGYVAGFITQPLSTHLTDVFQVLGLLTYVASNRSSFGTKDFYSAEVGTAYACYIGEKATGGGAWRFYGTIEGLAGKARTKTGYATHSKMHAECTAMVQLFILALAGGSIASLFQKQAGWWYLVLLCVVSLLNAYSIAFRRARRMFTRMRGIAMEFADEGQGVSNRLGSSCDHV